jgi:hypothetical protein
MPVIVSRLAISAVVILVRLIRKLKTPYGNASSMSSNFPLLQASPSRVASGHSPQTVRTLITDRGASRGHQQ